MRSPLFLKSKKDRHHQARERHHMVPPECFRFEKSEGENRENRQRNHFLNNFQLKQHERSSVPLKSDPVGRHQKYVLEKRNAPAQHDHQQLRQHIEPPLPPQVQLSVPCESHENIGDNEQSDCKIRFHYGSNQFLRDKITNYS